MQFPFCACCRVPMPFVPPGLPRRFLLRTGTVGAGLAVPPSFAPGNPAQGGPARREFVRAAPAAQPCKAMLLSCVDPRIQAPVAAWMTKPEAGSHAGLAGRYSQFTIAGAAVGVVAPAFPEAWREAFWDNFRASIRLHRIENLVVIDHENCGAIGLAYGEDVLNDPARERAAHMANAAALKQALSARHPDAGFQAWYLTRDSAGRFTQWKNLVPGRTID